MYSFSDVHFIPNIFCGYIGSSYEISVFGKQAKFLYPKSHQISGSEFLSGGSLGHE